jgi:hypothetical protein
MKILIPAVLLGMAIGYPASVAMAQEPQAAAQNSSGQAAPAAKKKAKGAAVLAAGQFANEADAKTHCPGDAVVWVNLGTKVYHQSGAATYGTTKHGAYMCEKDAAAGGFRAAKNEKRK